MSKKVKKYKVGIDSETFAISLVESPAIESDFVALAKEKEEKQQVFLESNEKHMVYGAALIPEKDIYRNNGENEYYVNFTKESIEKMSQEFMKEYRQHEVKTDHEDIANEVCVVESWLVSDAYKDKSNALGINVPEGTWMVGMKVNNVDAWERIKAGELKGFSVESMLQLEEFNKIDNNMEIQTNDMGFWNKMKEVLAEVFSKKEDYEPTEARIEELAANSGLTVEEYETEVQALKEEFEEAQEPQVAEPTAAEEPTETIEVNVEPPTEEAPTVIDENGTGVTEDVQPQVEDNKHLEELINSLKDEINALKELNGGLKKKVKELEKEPSSKPINTNAKGGGNANVGVNSSSYQAWREQMRGMIG